MKKTIKIAQKNIDVIDSKEAAEYVDTKIMICSNCQHKNILSNYDAGKTYFCKKCKNQL
jgi:hypothetical protein